MTLLTGNNPEANGDYTPKTVLAEGISRSPADQVAMDRVARARRRLDRRGTRSASRCCCLRS